MSTVRYFGARQHEVLIVGTKAGRSTGCLVWLSVLPTLLSPDPGSLLARLSRMDCTKTAPAMAPDIGFQSNDSTLSTIGEYL